MAITLHAHIPFPEQEDGLDVVFPRSTNAGLYARFEKVKDGETKTVEHVDGISVVVGQIDGFPEAHERVNEALRLLSTIKITRRGAELLLANFELNERNRPLLGIETMGDVVAEMEKHGPAVATAEASPRPSTGDTVVGMNTGDTKPIPLAKPGAPAPRKLSEHDWAKLRGEQPTDTHSAAEEALKRLRNRR
jgi:hypothetical protein